MNPVRFLENFCKHSSELGQDLLTFIYIILWECTSSIIKYGPFVFTVVPHKYVALFHHLEVGPFPENLGFPSIPGPFMRDDEYVGCPREVLDTLEIYVVDFSHVTIQVQYNGAYPLGFYYPPGAIEFSIVPWI